MTTRSFRHLVPETVLVGTASTQASRWTGRVKRLQHEELLRAATWIKRSLRACRTGLKDFGSANELFGLFHSNDAAAYLKVIH